MPHFPKPFFKRARRCWYIEIDRKQYNLGRSSAEEAWDKAAKLKDQLRHQRTVISADLLVALLDAFLEWTHRRRSPETYEWYRFRLELFARHYPDLGTANLTPQHVDAWVDGYAHLSPGSRRNYIRAIQRVMNWAVKQRLIPSSPIGHMEKPKPGRREQVVSRAEFDDLLELSPDPAFRDLLIVTWETGCRPQESLAVEARHVELESARWVFSASEAKTDTPRVVYLTETALEIVRQRMGQSPIGPLFRNSRGKPWTTDAVNNAMCRIQIRMGRRMMRERGLEITEDQVHAIIPQLKPTKKVRGERCKKSAAELREEARTKLRNRLASSLAPKYSLYALRHTWATGALERGRRRDRTANCVRYRT